MARPKKADAARREFKLGIRLTATEKRLVEERASEENKRTADYARERVLAAK